MGDLPFHTAESIVRATENQTRQRLLRVMFLKELTGFLASPARHSPVNGIFAPQIFSVSVPCLYFWNQL
jgi:hypothetical protein